MQQELAARAKHPQPAGTAAVTQACCLHALSHRQPCCLTWHVPSSMTNSASAGSPCFTSVAPAW
jgi:hypothetical protein